MSIGATYSQTSGRLFVYQHLGGADQQELFRTVGYAGFGVGLNQPLFQSHKSIGPLPRGVYHVGNPFTHERFGDFTFRLHPSEQNLMFGRSAFLIHSDSRSGKRDASRGCIVLHRSSRERLAELLPRVLIVGS
jgi:hypothetical protein